MALKGIGIDPNIYVEQGFYTPETYTTPPPSQGDYFTPQGYAELDYVLEALDLVSSFSIQAEGTLEIASATLVSTFTLTADGQDFDFASATLTSTFTTSTLGGYRHFGSASVVSTSTTTSDANITYDPSNTINVSTSTQQNGNVDYRGTPTLDSVATQISVGGIFYDAASEGQQDDYTWDTFAESEFIDRTWNEWFGGKWHPGLIAFIKTTDVSVNGGLIAGGSIQNARMVSNISADANVSYTDSATLSAAYSIQSDYTRTRNADPASYSIVSSTQQDANVSFDSDASVSSAISTTVNGNATFRAIQTYDITSSTSQNANVVFDPTKQITAAYNISPNANVSYDAGASFSAFNTTFTLGRLIVIADPWNILTVKQELRTLLVPRENNIFEVLQETRVNNIETETRGYKVPQETRAFKIYKPIFTRRSSIPKVRADR